MSEVVKENDPISASVGITNSTFENLGAFNAANTAYGKTADFVNDIMD